MRERLIELIANMVCDDYSPTCDEWQPHDCGICYANSCHIGDLADRILADGWIRPPCKVGDTVYVVKPYFSYISEYEVRGFHLGEFPTLSGNKRNPYLVGYFKTSGMLKHIFIKDIGKTVFLTREEAERALKEGV